MIPKHIIEKAIAGGWGADVKNRPIALEQALHALKTEGYEKIALDPDFWMALGKEMGWGKWTIPFEKFEHKWELDRYLPDTAKTPVYYCECGARKINDLIEWEEENDWYQKPQRTYQMERHGSRKKLTEYEYAHRFYDLILRKSSQEELDAYWKSL